MVAAAYEMSALQVRSAGNLKLGEFELIAKVPHGSSRHQVNLMLRQLLSERFQMTVHTEKQELPVYVLAIGKQPPTLQESTASSEETPALRLDVSPTGIFTLTGRQRSMKELADTLSTALFRPVVDATELKGNYDFSLAWMANQQMPQPRKSEMPPGMKSVPYNPQAAVDVQLGMKIESRKMPVDILMIDSAKAPESND
jgi:uncharacterized protein (TIGR03435 family)